MSETNPTGHIKISKLDTLTEIKDGDKLIIPVSNDTSNNGTPQWTSYSVSTSVLSKFIGNSLDLSSKFPSVTEGTGIIVTSTTDELGKTTYTVKNSGVTDVNTTYTLCGVGLDKNSVGTVRISVTPGEVKEGNSSVVTGGAVHEAINSYINGLNQKLPGVIAGTGITVEQNADGNGKITYTVSSSIDVGIDTTSSYGVNLDRSGDGKLKVNVNPGKVNSGDNSVVTGKEVYSYIHDSLGSAAYKNEGDFDAAGAAEAVEAKFPVVIAESGSGIKVTSSNIDGKTEYKLDRSFRMLYYMGYHENLSDLPSTNQKNGDVWSVGSSSNSCSFYVWDGNQWVNMSGLVQNDVDTLKGVVETLKSNVETLNGKFVQWTYGGNFNVGEEIPVSEFMTHPEVRHSLTFPIMYVYNTQTTAFRQNYLMIWRNLTDLVYSFAFFNGETIVKKVLTLNATKDTWTVTQ